MVLEPAAASGATRTWMAALAPLVLALAALQPMCAHAQSSGPEPEARQFTLHYDQPARFWTEALPIGNGRLGAMVFGKVGDELLQLNEATMWSGGPVARNVNPEAYQHLAPLRQALAAGDYAGATQLARKMQGDFSQGYLPLADLRIRQDLGPVSGYRRDLNIRDGVATTTFVANGVRFTREVFASAPGQVIVLRLSADQPRQLTLDIDADSQLRFATAAEGDALVVRGKAPAHVDPNYHKVNPEPIVYDDPTGCRGMRFQLMVQPRVREGSIRHHGGRLEIRGASEVELLVSAATSFAGFDQCPDSAGRDEKQLAQQYLQRALVKDYAALLAEHKADVRKYFDRVSLRLDGTGPDQTGRTTLERLEAYLKGASDPQLEALYFQYGRYLMIASSRTKDAPANLQGIWNNLMRPPWSSNYTTNINAQMNYWPVESANLSEMFEPLDGLVRNMAVTGGETARSFYRLPGWVVHHNSDIWAASDPVGARGLGNPGWANWYMGGAWISRHMWEHYQYSHDKAYLRSAYPTMKGAAEFMLGWLQKAPNGELVTSPSTSPENTFYYDGKKRGNVTVGAAMDLGILRDLFANVEAAAQVLGTDPGLRARLKSARSQLAPFRIGARGQLQEWQEDFEEAEPDHRHVSHLYALHPAQDISPLATPALAAAARRTLELRGDGGTGWSLAWKVNMWARLLDGDHAYKLFRNMLRLTKEDLDWNKGGGGVYANLFDAHPPFQIDGNFGGTAGVIEMLLQSQNNELHLLPALPAAWRSGEVRGLVGRGSFVVDIGWREGKLATAVVEARTGGQCTLRTAGPVRVAGVAARSRKSAIGYTTTFKARPGIRYRIHPL